MKHSRETTNFNYSYRASAKEMPSSRQIRVSAFYQFLFGRELRILIAQMYEIQLQMMWNQS